MEPKNRGIGPLFLALSLLVVPVTAATSVDYGDIKPEYLPPSPWPVVTYRDPGKWSTIDVTKHGLKPNTDVDAAEVVRKILADTKGRRRLFFPAGTYVLKSPLFILEGDIWLDGAGKKTRFVLDFEEGKEYNCIFFKGDADEPLALAGTPKRGDSSVELMEKTDLKVGDLVRVYHNVKDNRGYGFPRGQICWVTGVQDKTVTLDLKVGADLEGACFLRRIRPLRNVRCTNFSMMRKRRGPMGDHNLQLEYCANAEVRNVESSHATTYCIRLVGCRDAIVTECVVHDYWVKKGYNGYGIHAEQSSGVNIVANRGYNLRHHFELSWGTSYSVAAYNVADPDYNYCDVGGHHGDLGYCNLFEGNKGSEVTFDWGESSWNAYNFFYRNHASSRVGSYRPKRAKRWYLVIIGNETSEIVTQATRHPYVGANIVKGQVQWGDVPQEGRLPPSLFLDEKPAYLKGQQWPLFGPPVGKGWSSRPRPATDAHPTQPQEPTPEDLNAQADALESRCVAAEEKKNYALAVRLYEQYVERFPKASRFKEVKARLDSLKADKAIQAAIEATEADAECKRWMSMAENFARAGMCRKAREYLNKIVEKHGDTDWAAKARARLAKLPTR